MKANDLHNSPDNFIQWEEPLQSDVGGTYSFQDTEEIGTQNWGVIQNQSNPRSIPWKEIIFWSGTAIVIFLLVGEISKNVDQPSHFNKRRQARRRSTDRNIS